MTATAPLALFLGDFAAGFREGVAPLLATPWRTASVAAATPEPERTALLGEAAAVVASRYGADLPPAPALRLVQVPGAGFDGVDLAAVPPRAAVCNVFEHEPGVAEFALLAMLEWCHKLKDADAEVRAGDWSRSGVYGGAPDDELFGKTLAIVGMGRIGQGVASRAAAFGMRIVAVNRTVRPPPPGVERLHGLDRLRESLKEADFVVLACALTPETTGLIDAAALAAMRLGALIVNVARGPVIDEAALWDALTAGRIGGAAIDTWWRYPSGPRAADHEPDRPFRTLPNTLLSPHVAGWTRGTAERRTRFIAAQLDRLAGGEALQNVVRPPAD